MFFNIEKIVVNNNSFDKLVESICLFQNQSIRFSNDYLILGTDQNQIEVKCELFEKTIFNFVYKINWNGSLLRFICYEEISKVFKGGENKIVIASFAFDGFAIFGSILLNKNNNIPLKEIKEIETNIVELISAIEMCIATNNIKTVIMIYRFIDKTNLYLNEKINSDLLDGIKHTINVIEKKSNALDDEYIVKFNQLKSKVFSLI